MGSNGAGTLGQTSYYAAAGQDQTATSSIFLDTTSRVGLFGTTTDSISGAAFEYTPNQYLVMLNPLNTTSIEQTAVVPQPDRVRLFILHRHKDLRFDLSRGFGEDLASLLTLLAITEANRQATTDRLRTLARTYPDPMVFADHVISLEIAAK